MFGWGANGIGQLGQIPTGSGCGTIDGVLRCEITPIPVVPGTTVSGIAAAGQSSYVVTSAGAVREFGASIPGLTGSGGSGYTVVPDGGARLQLDQ